MITRALLKTIKSDAEAVLASVAEKHGVKISFGNGKFSADNATLKLEIASIAANGQVKTKEATDFERYASAFGLKPEDLGTIFTYNGREFKLIGAKPRSTKFPLLAEWTKNGKVFKLPKDAVNPNIITGLTEAAKQEFLSLASRLSPENLHCDGEVSRTEANRRRAAINREWKDLEQRVGRKITEDQVWTWV